MPDKIAGAIIKRLKSFKKYFATNGQLRRELNELKKKLDLFEPGWPPGHFYSPIPSLEQIRCREEEIWNQSANTLPGISLRQEEQLLLIKKLSSYYHLHPWTAEKKLGIRYYFNNPNFSYGESIMLFCLLMHFKPSRVVEIGSGYSSCVLLDTNELFLQHSLTPVFVEPYPELLLSLIKKTDLEKICLRQANLQDVDMNVFSNLAAGDFLIIDSTHVSKIDSDVNHILFKILPALKAGVYIHFHDIWFPFEYPKEWIYQGRAWNEVYVLRAFLQYNTNFEIVLFNSMLGKFHCNILEDAMPLCAKNPGTSIWLKKL